MQSMQGHIMLARSFQGGKNPVPLPHSQQTTHFLRHLIATAWLEFITHFGERLRDAVIRMVDNQSTLAHLPAFCCLADMQMVNA